MSVNLLFGREVFILKRFETLQLQLILLSQSKYDFYLSDIQSQIFLACMRVPGSQSSKQAKLGTLASTQLDASVESFAKYIKDHFAGQPFAVPEVSSTLFTRCC